jgi:hypothetical protein
MIDNKSVLWVDDEPRLMDAELFDLENHFFVPVAFQWVGDALDWLEKNISELAKLERAVIDVQLPSRADPRFTSPEGVPVGVKFCECLMLNAELWQLIKPKIVLYTRLPSSSPAASHAQSFSNANGIVFKKKFAASRVAIDLIQEKLI